MTFESGTGSPRHAPAKRFRRLAGISVGAGMLLVLGINQPAAALNFDLFGIEGDWSLTGSYAYAVRLSEQAQTVINTAGREVVPIPEALKYPNSFNFDDADRNFEQWDPVANRVTLFSELQLDITENFGLKFSGDAFYDHVYHSDNSYEKPKDSASDSLNTRQLPKNTFTEDAEYLMGGRARLLDAYLYGAFLFDNGMALDFKIGEHVAAWGQSLFFAGVARAQGPADATRATVPGADVKSILLPVTQISARLRLNSKITLLANQKLEFQPNLLNPTGSFYSASDIIGPGAEFAYGIRNPLHPDNLADLQINQDLGKLLGKVFGVPALGGALGGLTGLLDNLGLSGTLEDLLLSGALANALRLSGLDIPRGINVERKKDIRPEDDDTGQWGLGIEYNLSWTTVVGYYHLNYHSHIPLPRQNYGYATILPAQNGLPEITTKMLAPPDGLLVPVTYNLVYFEDIKMDALSFSTVLFGANVAGELIYRRGAPTLVDVPQGISGFVPTPTRMDTYQLLLNGIKTFGPGALWDSMIVVFEAGYIRADNVQGQKSIAELGDTPPASAPADERAYYGTKGKFYNQITDRFDQDAAAFSTRIIVAYNNLFPGWDLTIPINISGAVYNRSPMPGAFASLMGEGDYRLGIGFNFTRLQKFTIGFSYSGFLNKADENDRPLQDRDTIGLTLSYNFL